MISSIGYCCPLLLIKLADFLCDFALELLDDPCPLLPVPVCACCPPPASLKKQSFKYGLFPFCTVFIFLPLLVY